MKDPCLLGLPKILTVARVSFLWVPEEGRALPNREGLNYVRVFRDEDIQGQSQKHN